jgi:hypothetical protein
MSHVNLNTVRCEALFASTLQDSDDPYPEQVRATITATVRSLGTRGCVAWMAQEFGDHPDTAVTRMAWARAAIARVYGTDPIAAAPRPRRSLSASLRRLDAANQVRESTRLKAAISRPRIR